MGPTGPIANFSLLERLSMHVGIGATFSGPRPGLARLHGHDVRASVPCRTRSCDIRVRNGFGIVWGVRRLWSDGDNGVRPHAMALYRFRAPYCPDCALDRVCHALRIEQLLLA